MVNNIPDFTMKQTFPIATVIEAAQRRAKMEQENRDTGNRFLIQGLQDFGQGVDSLVQRRKQMAEAMAVKKALGMTDSDSMTAEQAISAYRAKNNSKDDLEGLLLLLSKLRGDGPALSKTPPAPATPPATAPPVLGAPQLASASPTLMGGLPPPTTTQAEVPASPASLMPNMKIGKGTLGALKTLASMQPHKTMTPDQALAAGEVPAGTDVIRPTVPMLPPEEKTLDRIIARFDQDPQVHKQQQALDGATAVRDLIVSGNPIAANAIPTYMARASGEVGNLSEFDKKPFGGSRAILTRMEAAFTQMATGQLTQTNRDFLLEMSDLMESSANKNIDKHARNVAKQYAKAHKMKDREIFETLRPGREFDELKSFDINRSTGTYSSSDKEAQYQAWKKKKLGN